LALKLFNTLGRTLQEFEELKTGSVGLYTCGPTVYNYAHIGNLRTYLFEDILRRTLEYFGYNVEHIMNVTDVGHLTDDADEGEDKMIKSSREKGMTVWEIADFFTDAFFADTDALNIIRPTVTCRATKHIEEMISLVKRLEDMGYTYTAGGNVYFDISKYENYGKLALLDRQNLKAGARIGVDDNKKNPQDFVLWFTKSKFEHQSMLWDSPWGNGYPGWHLECSAMSMKYLGEQFDIHCGGIDHIPVHHTNEIAQSEAATGSRWVNYWLHGEFLIMDKGKMSKSKGGFITLTSLKEKGFDPLDYRFFLLQAHYRSQLTFNLEALAQARSARENLTGRIQELLKEAGDENSPDRATDFSPPAQVYQDTFRKHLSLDLNVPRALAELWGVLKDPDIEAGEKLLLAYEMDRVLGLDLAKIERNEERLDEKNLSLIREREESRAGKDFQRADEIRDLLLESGIVIMDTPQGTRWKKV
jgi:cysteinyl-tRNA synthetase